MLFRSKNFRRAIQLLRCQKSCRQETPAPCFFMSFNGFRPPTSSLCPAGHTSDAIPTGPASQSLPAHRRGIAWSGHTFGPALCPRNENRPRLIRAGTLPRHTHIPTLITERAPPPFLNETTGANTIFSCYTPGKGRSQCRPGCRCRQGQTYYCLPRWLFFSHWPNPPPWRIVRTLPYR